MIFVCNRFLWRCLCCHFAFFDISAGVGAFVIGLSQISSFFSYNICHNCMVRGDFRFRSGKHILSKLDLAPVNFHNSKCLAMKLIQYTYKFK